MQSSSQGMEPARGEGGGWEDQAYEWEHSPGSLDAQQAFLGPGGAVMSLSPAGVWGREDPGGGGKVIADPGAGREAGSWGGARG